MLNLFALRQGSEVSFFRSLPVHDSDVGLLLDEDGNGALFSVERDTPFGRQILSNMDQGEIVRLTTESISSAST